MSQVCKPAQVAGTGTVTGWKITTLKKPIPMAWFDEFHAVFVIINKSYPILSNPINTK
jgi:hypothetical protein